MHRSKYVLVTLCAAAVVGTARGQMNYVNQERSVSVFKQGGGGDPHCSLSATAPDFNPFSQSLGCVLSFVQASQFSSLDPSQVSCTASARAPSSVSNATSTMDVDFTLSGVHHYTLTGHVSTSQNVAEVRLTGPTGEIVHPSGSVLFNYCGMLAAGSYEIYARAHQTLGPGTSANALSLNLHIAEPGDVNADNVVNVSDVLAAIATWGSCPAQQPCFADFNCDGMINITDLLYIISNWG